MQRRVFIKQSVAAAALSATGFVAGHAQTRTGMQRHRRTRLKLGLNAYSFNDQLRSGAMTMKDVIDFCSEHEVDGVDMTGYYFPGYPQVASDSFIYELKRYAFLNGVTISGTGVRNDFTSSDPANRAEQIQLVKNWVEVAAKLGADVVRVFAGPGATAGFTFARTLEWMIPAFQECAAYGRDHGVIIGLQHHNDFLRTADQTIQVVEAVNSPWFKVILDVGSLRQIDVYEEIEKLLPYTATWQIKEEVWYGDRAMPINLPKLKAIIDRSAYRGFLPIETLGTDTTVEARVRRVTQFLGQVKEVFFH